MFAQLHGNVDHQPAPSVHVVLPGFRQQTGDEAVKIFIELLSTHTHTRTFNGPFSGTTRYQHTI